MGRHTVPPHTSKRRKTTNLNTRNNHNCQKNKLYMGVGQSRVKEETFIQTGWRGRDGQSRWRGLVAKQRLAEREVPHLRADKPGGTTGEQDRPQVSSVGK